MERLRSWLLRHRDQTSVTYSRFGRVGEEQDDKPPPTAIYVAPFDENANEFLFFNYWHVQKAAASSACFGMSLVVLFFILTLMEFDWEENWHHHKRGTDVSALLALFLYLVIGVLVHYYVLIGIKRQSARFLLPFIFVYSFLLTSEIFWCLILFFKAVEPGVGPELASSHPPFLLLFFLVSCSVVIQSLMLASVLRCRQYLSQKQDHELALKVANKSRNEFPSIQIVVASHQISNNATDLHTNGTSADENTTNGQIQITRDSRDANIV